MENMTIRKNTIKRPMNLTISIGCFMANMMLFNTMNSLSTNLGKNFNNEPIPPMISSKNGIFGSGILNPGNPIFI
jgi:hypothetical protein